MQNKNKWTYPLSEISDVARELWALFGTEQHWLFEGPMGSGKTTLIGALAATMGFTGVVQSPTYTLIHEYGLADGGRLIHMDLYRLTSAEEAFEAGVWDYLQGPYHCFIEWPQIIRPWMGWPVINCYLRSLHGSTHEIEIIKR